MKRTEYKIGEFLYGITDTEESATIILKTNECLSTTDIRTVTVMGNLSDGMMV